MFKFLFLLLVFTFLCSNAWAVDAFAAIKCGADIPKALIGKRMSEGPGSLTEQRHNKDIGLKDLGADEAEPGDTVTLIGWQICGNEYQMLVNNHSIITDVISIPPRSKNLLEVHGYCQINAKDFPQAIFAVVDNSAGYSLSDKSLAKKMLTAKFAWKIDQANQRFVPLPAETVACSLEMVFGWKGY